MAPGCFLFFLVALSSSFGLLQASSGDADPVYQVCVEQCEKTGCVGSKCFQHCRFMSNENLVDGPQHLREPLYVKWKQWDCRSDCKHYCMLSREDERQKLGLNPVKYHDKWLISRIHGIQEPVSVALAALNLAVQFHGWISFFVLVNYKLPLRPDKTTYYEYTGVWHVYSAFVLNSWFWTTIFLGRDVELTQRLHLSAGMALQGYSLFVATVRIFNVRVEATRVMVAAPVFAFMTTHILFLNFYEFDLGWQWEVSVVISALLIVLWAVWAGLTRHPSRWKVWVVLSGGVLALLLKVFDFPPYWRLFDNRALWHATMIPLGYLWWSFVRDDADFRTSILLRKNK